MDIVEKLKELTNVDFERDSAETECEHSSLRSLLTQFLEQEARSGSMDLTLSKSLTLGKAQANLAMLSLNRDFGCITPLYVYRMWGGNVAIEDIENCLMELKEQGFMVG